MSKKLETILRVSTQSPIEYTLDKVLSMWRDLSVEERYYAARRIAGVHRASTLVEILDKQAENMDSKYDATQWWVATQDCPSGICEAMRKSNMQDLAQWAKNKIEADKKKETCE